MYRVWGAAAEREGNNLKYFCLKNGPSRDQNLGLTVLCVPNSLGSQEGGASDIARVLGGWSFWPPRTPAAVPAIVDVPGLGVVVDRHT